MQHIKALDFVKGCAILCVILLHSLTNVYQPFFNIVLEQAIPLFIIVMGITGYLSYSSGKFRKIRYLLNKFIRYFPVWILFWFSLVFFFGGQVYGHWWYALFFQLPSAGPGNYFLGVIVQSIIILPALCYAMQKNPGVMIVISFALSLAFELFGKGVGELLYEMLIIRYLFLLVLGIWYGQMITENKKPDILFFALAIVSGLYLVKYENALSVFSALFTLGLIYIAVNYNISSKLIEELGKASYHIYLTQIVIFGECLFILNELSASAGIYIVICCGAGYLIYLSERKVTEYLNTI